MGSGGRGPASLANRQESILVAEAMRAVGMTTCQQDAFLFQQIEGPLAHATSTASPFCFPIRFEYHYHYVVLHPIKWFSSVRLCGVVDDDSTSHGWPEDYIV
jgi:hypothetical protein